MIRPKHSNRLIAVHIITKETTGRLEIGRTWREGRLADWHNIASWLSWNDMSVRLRHEVDWQVLGMDATVNNWIRCKSLLLTAM